MGGPAYYVLNRAARRLLFQKDEVSQPESEEELEALRQCVRRRSPFGQADWQERTAARLGLESTLRPRGRPKNTKRMA